ncbi:hypothetical protein CRG98_030054 [Punica granatum]|uniref:Uncharacterized protein n=1 Tax=Punica granatum TaxID=22663 RepID=A0A2I0IZY7_PUNGR|nr:hypothetical protein CRG98_030054 [Punica granatum]
MAFVHREDHQIQSERGTENLKPEREIPIPGPPPGPHVTISSRDPPPDIEEQPHSHVGNVLGVNAAGVGHGDPAAAALSEEGTSGLGVGEDELVEGEGRFPGLE